MAFLIPEEAFVSKILNDAEIQGRVANRLYPSVGPQKGGFPFGVYSRLVSPYSHHMGGSSQLMTCVIQCDWYARTYGEAKELAELARMAVDGFKGTVTIDGDSIVIQKFHLTQDADVYIQPESGSEDGIFGVSQQYEIGVTLQAPDLT